MKIKRFFAADIRQAMRMVRDELGADAVILSNRSVDGGVEIVAARDFDEQFIQSKVQKPAAPEPAKLPEPSTRSYEMPDFEAEKKHLHIISSERKRSADSALEQRPLRRNTDQYVGYAEKVHLRTTQVNQALTREPADDIKIGLTGHAKPEEAGENGYSGQLLMEMSKELKYLRTALDSRLLELNSANKDNSVKGELLQRLGTMGISSKLSAKIAERLGNQADAETAFSKAQDMLTKVLPVVEGNMLDAGGIFALVGPTGVGKTTSVAKMAAKFILKHGSRQVALITTDNYRIGAYEQLNTYGRILGIPVRAASSASELRNLIHEFADKRLVLIDTAGMSQRSMKLTEQINTLQQSNIAVTTCLVMSAATEYRAMNQIIEAFQVFEPQASILTKLDEAVSIGAALSSVIEYNLPLAFVTDGQQVPEDIHRASARALINQCVTDAISESNYTDDESAQTWMAQSYA